MLVRCIGLGVPELLESILTLMPLDDYVESPVAMMEAPGAEEPPIWAEYRRIIAEKCGDVKISHIEHDAFIERARRCYSRDLRGGHLRQHPAAQGSRAVARPRA